MPGHVLMETDKEMVPQKYLCSYCKLLLRDARQTPCGHFYCESCVGNLMKGDKMICLEDNQKITVHKLYPDNFVRREVLSLVVSCTNIERGCIWRGEVRHLEPHLLVCEFQAIECTHPECGMPVLRRELQAHLDTECQYRTQPCSFCRKQVVLANIAEHHNNECMLYPVSCPRCHKDEIPRESMAVHLDPMFGDCPELEGPCTFSTIGCPVKEFMNKHKRSEHLNENTTYHLSLLQKDYLDLKTRTEKENNAQLSRSPASHPAGLNDQLMTDLMAKMGQLVQDNVNMKRVISDQNAQLLDMERRIALASESDFSPATSLKMSGNEPSDALKDIRKRIISCETTVAQLQVYHIDNIRRTSEQGEVVSQVQRNVQQSIESQKILETRIQSQDTTAGMNNVALADLAEELSALRTTTFDGILVWKIPDVARKRAEAVAGRVTSFYSQPFYSGHQGYKMCARIYLNGDGIGRGKCISLFFAIMRGEYDALLRWPFRQKVTLMLLDQDNVEHVIDAFRPDPNSSSFQKPRGEMNVASGCPMFCPLTELDKHAYIRDDTLFIKAIVDTFDSY